MKFTPKSEKEIKEANLMIEGYYNFEVIKAEDAISQNKNTMISLQLKVKDINNRDRIVFDNLMEAFGEKLRGFCYAVGLENEYESGELSSNDCKNKYGRAHIVIAPEKIDKGKTYKAKNEVKQYFVLGDQQASETGIIDDAVPF